MSNNSIKKKKSEKISNETNFSIKHNQRVVSSNNYKYINIGPTVGLTEDKTRNFGVKITG